MTIFTDPIIFHDQPTMVRGRLEAIAGLPTGFLPVTSPGTLPRFNGYPIPIESYEYPAQFANLSLTAQGLMYLISQGMDSLSVAGLSECVISLEDELTRLESEIAVQQERVKGLGEYTRSTAVLSDHTARKDVALHDKIGSKYIAESTSLNDKNTKLSELNKLIKQLKAIRRYIEHNPDFRGFTVDNKRDYLIPISQLADNLYKDKKDAESGLVGILESPNDKEEVAYDDGLRIERIRQVIGGIALGAREYLLSILHLKK